MPPLKRSGSAAGDAAAKTAIGDTARGAVSTGKGALSKVGGAIKKAAPIIGKGALLATGAALPVAAVGGIVKGVNALRNRGKNERLKADKDAEIDKQVDKYVEKRKNPEGINKVDGKQFDSRGQKPIETKPTETKTEIDKIADTPRSEIKKSGRTSMIKKNIDRFGKDRVQHLQDKQKDFKLMRKGGMSKDDFIKKYPKSITAQRSKGLRDHTEWDAYDMVLEYLFSTEQVATIEEANYVMTEMDSKTIQSIISD